MKGKLIILSGFSGSGKGTIVKKLLNDYPDEFALSISATTRNPRPGEQEGVDYFYKTNEEFQEMIKNGELIEYAGYVDHYYGTPKKFVMDQLDLGKNVILEIEIQGALQIKKLYPETILIFVMTPTAEILRERLIGRGTETPEVIDSRLARAVKEAEGCEVYDYLIINDEIETSVQQMRDVIRASRFAMSGNLSKVEQFKNELKGFVKGDQ